MDSDFTQNSDSLEAFEIEYDSRFAWRRKQQIFNLREISQIAGSRGGIPLEAFPKILQGISSDYEHPINALRWSVMLLAHEATECFIFGQFQSCIISCGSVIERVLKVEYESTHGSLPTGHWTLGKSIKQLDWSGTRITSEVLILAEQLIEPRNSRTHALLEHSDPMLARLGGNRGVEIINPSAYLIEHFRGDAKAALEVMYEILRILYA